MLPLKEFSLQKDGRLCQKGADVPSKYLDLRIFFTKYKQKAPPDNVPEEREQLKQQGPGLFAFSLFKLPERLVKDLKQLEVLLGEHHGIAADRIVEDA